MKNVAENAPASNEKGGDEQPENPSAEASSTSPPVPASPPDSEEVGTFKLRVRGIRQLDAEARVIEADSPESAIERALELDVSRFYEPVLNWSDCNKMVAIDLDRPSNASPVNELDIPTYFPDSLPRPFCTWSTHDGGLRAIFVQTPEATAMELAAVWYLFAPLGPLVGWRGEVKSDSRHPGGERDGTRCGRIVRFAPSANIVIPGNGGRSVASEPDIQRWLDERGLTVGRHSAEHCPWCGGAPATCNPSLDIDQERGVRCYRCGRSASWDALVGDFVRSDRPTIYEAARALVHFPHQELILRDLRPSVPADLLQPAWHALLREAHRDHLHISDPDLKAAWKTKIERAASHQIDIVRSSSGQWLDRGTFTPRKVSADRTLKMLPWAQSPVMIDAAANSAPLRGFTPITPLGVSAVVGPFVDPPAGSIFSRMPAHASELPPVDLGAEPPSAATREQAWIGIEQHLPGIDRTYLSTLLSAQFVAQRAIGTPPIICVTGPTGSGKTATQQLAASMVGTRAGAFELGESRATLRALGLLLTSGHHITYVDEVGRIYDLYWRLEPILRANSCVTFEAKYHNERTIRLTAPISLLGSTLPTSVVRSPEIGRRAVGIRLRGAYKSWKLGGNGDDKGVDFADARSLEALRPHLDAITAAIWWDIELLGASGDWRQVCLTKYGAVPLEALDLLDADSAGRDDVIRKLYETFRTAKDGALSQGIRWKGWLPADPRTPAGDLLGELVNFDDKTRQESDIADLERLNLEAILGFADPALVLKVQRRSAQWLIKFIETGVAKGKGRKRSDFPQAIKPKDTTDAREKVEL